MSHGPWVAAWDGSAVLSVSPPQPRASAAAAASNARRRRRPESLFMVGVLLCGVWGTAGRDERTVVIAHTDGDVSANKPGRALFGCGVWRIACGGERVSAA